MAFNKSCDCIPEGCDVCYPLAVPYCPALITIPAGLKPGNQYYLWISDLFENLYYDLVTVDANGAVTINTANFPKGIFNANQGKLTMFLTEDIQGMIVVPMTIDKAEWNCVIITVDEPTFFINEQGCRLFINEDNIELFIKE